MPDDTSSQPPTGNPENPSPAQPIPPPIEQGVVRQASHTNTNEKPTNTAELAKDVHWIHYATLWSQIGLGLIGLGALWIYHGQLNVMNGQLEQMRGSGRQTDKLISLYQQQVAQLTKQAGDTHDLAVAAGTQAINAGEQVKKLEAGVKETHALATAAQTANKNAVEADRPWIGGALTVQDFEANKIPTYTIIWVNTGKRPAKITLTISKSGPFDFGVNPQYTGYHTVPSINLIVPGQPMTHAWQDDGPISEPEMAALKAGTLPFRVYAKIEYSDLRTNISYWTHMCWRYMPTMPYMNGGFANCAEYTDAK